MYSPSYQFSKDSCVKQFFCFCIIFSSVHFQDAFFF